MSTSPVTVGIVGLGRSGWDIHAAALQRIPERYRVVAVTDLIEARRQQATEVLSCRAYSNPADLFADPEVELVIVASPNYLHPVHTIAALQAGKAVVCEKPVAPRLVDLDSMIAAAERTGNLFTVFQNRRYDPGFRKIKEVIASGKLGRIVEIKISAHSFGRRWDWQTLRGYAAGQLRNNGVHFLDHAVELMGFAEPEVFSHLERTLALGDAPGGRRRGARSVRALRPRAGAPQLEPPGGTVACVVLVRTGVAPWRNAAGGGQRGLRPGALTAAGGAG